MTINLSSASMLEPHTVATYAGLFHALSDPTRLAIVQHLTTGEHRVRDLVAHMRLAQSTISTHLACLRGYGLVTVRPEGRSSWFSLSEPELLGHIFVSAHDMLHATGTFIPLRDHLEVAPHTQEHR